MEDYLKRNSSFSKQYRSLGEVGEGAFGKVHLVRHRTEKKKYVAKLIRTKNESELNQAKSEIRILKGIEHPHIVLFKGEFEVPNGVIVVMEYCENGDLSKSIASRTPTLDFFSEPLVIDWGIQICKALQYLHLNNILHRDLKPANIFLAKNDVIKLGDFGVARQLADVVDVALTVVGTPLYLSPEVIQMKPYNHKSDVWAAGCCIFEIMALNPAIDPIPVRISRQWNVRPMPLNYSKLLCDVVEWMLTIESSQRPPIKHILQKLLCIQIAGQRTPTAIDPATTARGPSKAALDHQTAQGTSKSSQSSPSLSQDVLTNRMSKKTLDVPRKRGKFSPSLDSGVVVDEKSTPVAFVSGLRPSPLVSSVAEVDGKEPADDGFWQISDSSIVDNLAALGVKFNEKGQLIELSTGGRFRFDSFSDDRDTNQLRYEEIGEQITRYVYNLLETKLHMKRRWLPIDASDEPRSFVFVTDDFATNDKKLLVLVQGPGIPRAGQWARKVIINDSLAAGTQIPWIQRAVKEGYAVIVLNPNLNSHEVTGTPIRENEDGAKHILYVWDKVISTEDRAPKIAFAAHSGGVNTVVHLAIERETEFRNRVFGIALADSCHDFGANKHRSVVSLFAKRGRNWVSSEKPLDTALTSDPKNVPKFSAGETRHDWTPGSCIPSAFKFLQKRYKKQ